MQELRPIRVLLAQPRGFCAGVERAIEIVEQALSIFGAPVYVRHEIVHNKRVVETLKKKGAIFVEEVDDIPDGGVTIFSAHGISEAVENDAKQRSLPIIDATCPLVSKVHKEGQNHASKGRDVVLIGHAGHPEVEGTIGQAPAGTIRLIQTLQDAETVTPRDPQNLAYATQTTLSVDDTAAIVAVLQRRFPAIRGPNKADICYATTNRQQAVKALAPRSDVLLVVGAPNSSNSQRLVEVAALNGCPRSILVQNASEIDWQMLEGARVVGVTAGASAPEILVQEVIAKLQELGARRVAQLEGIEENVVFPLPKGLAA